MVEDSVVPTDPAAMVVPVVGRLVETGERYEPYRLVGLDTACAEAAEVFFRDLLASGRASSTVRSYGMDLLRWFRFLTACGTGWDRATRAQARDFCRWMQVAGKRPGGNRRIAEGSRPSAAAGESGAFAPSVCVHSETVLRRFYDVLGAAAPSVSDAGRPRTDRPDRLPAPD